MPEIFYNPIDRRTFIKSGLAAIGTLVTIGTAASLGIESDKEQVARWAFMADTHISTDPYDNYRQSYPHHNLRRAVSDIISMAPDAIVIAGDLARQKGQSGDYENLKHLLNPIAEKLPIFLALGNHDNRDNFLHIFDQTPGQKQSAGGRHITVVDKIPIRLIILDSLFYVNQISGLLGKAQRQWLEEYLNNSDDTPTILCFHHTLGDGDGDLLDVPRLFDIIKSVSKVKAILFGHSHIYNYSEYEGIHLINLPAMGYNFIDVAPIGWVEAHLTAKGGTFILHDIAGNKFNNKSETKLTWR